MSAISFDDGDGWDRFFLDLSSKCAEPILWGYSQLRYRLIMPLDPKLFDNAENQIIEIAKRCLIGCGFIAAVLSIYVPVTILGLGAMSKALRWVGFSLQKNNYTHVRGDANEKALNEHQAKLMTWNICGIGGGMHFDHGGVNSWQARIDSILRKIKEEDPDVLVLQEVYDTALAEKIIEELKTDYAHFFIHLGKNILGSVGGTMVITKCAVDQFTNESFDNNDWTLNRTFASLTIKESPDSGAPFARIIGTHLIHSDNEKRMEQFDQIRHSFQDTLSTVIMGDLNLKKNDPEEGGKITPYLIHGYTDDEPTATNEMLRIWDSTEDGFVGKIDYISLFKETESELQNTTLIRAFDKSFNTKTALSDHHALVSTLIIN